MGMIVIRSPWELERLTVSGGVVAEILQALKERMAPGVSTQELDELALRHCLKRKVLPAFKGYHGYPHSLCVSVNEEVVHGFPSGRKLAAGDIV
ncbi:MAG: M24 family metallopeptidase, partial [Desulfobacteraceae bacterium]